MNILFFLIPKSQVVYAEDDYTLRQVAEKLQNHGYTAIPILNKEGKYVATISDGDLFWFTKEQCLMNYKEAEGAFIMNVPLKREYKSIRFDAQMKDLMEIAVNQNFVPVLDDNGIFIGIVTRKSIIEYFARVKDRKQKKVDK